MQPAIRYRTGFGAGIEILKFQISIRHRAFAGAGDVGGKFGEHAARVTRGGGGGFPIAKTSMDNPLTARAAEAIRALDQRLVQLPTIGGSLPFATFSDTLGLPTIGLAVVNFDNNQHAANENIRVGHFWEAIDIFAALVTMK